ncbi:citrate/2-methylcitrate synthase [Nonomuraea angiospora]|uniref:citrate synthase (unknown stereospecificity) n=1 Tax=Nonomuraea angiospora TaxID=46172 RepID=A0ABR9LZ34_9ACTN|nr:citrate synthase [Nonomuraea angiospora]MBE1585615.1 citrate synthase [Nonomuraea angiospora]
MLEGPVGVEWIDAATASERLGVKPATLYAYVSRGVLQRRHSDDGRRSLFSAEEIERLARRGRPRSQPPELVIESAITALGVDRPHYRGLDALGLALTSDYETVAAWLWTADPSLWHPLSRSTPAKPPHPSATPARHGDPHASAPQGDPHASAREGDPHPSAREGDPHASAPQGDPHASAREGDPHPSAHQRDPRRLAGPAAPGTRAAAPHPATETSTQGVGIRWPEPWRCEDDALRAAVTAQRGLPDDLLPLDRLQVITTVLGASDSLRYQLDPDSVAATGRRMIAGLVDALPQLSEPQGDSIAERLWSRLCPRPATPGLLNAVQAALVLLADHELAASTLAARVAASAKADPYAVVLTGLGVLGGPLHGGASYGAERLLAEVTEPRQAARAIAERVRRGERIPGFGHSVYKNGDARGALLLDLVKEAAPGHDRITAGVAVLEEMRRRRLPERNVDFALATLTAVSGMVSGAGEAIFAVARVAGWLAHAMEEYDRGTLLRLRASYTGPPVK